MASEKILFRLDQPHGAGNIAFKFQNGSSGVYLATTGGDCQVNVFDRYGTLQDRIKLQNVCTGMAWDSDGDLLAILAATSPTLVLWDANAKKKSSIDMRLKDNLVCLVWAKNSPLLAIGTAKGNVSIYNHNTSKRVPIIGKHSKRIVCAAWNNDNLLALASDDKTISISNVEGDTIRLISLRAEPVNVQFSEMKMDERIPGENTVSVIVGKRTLFLYNLVDPDNPIELAFQTHYGAIVTYKWFGDGYILVGFSAGYFVAISTHIKEVGRELFQVKNHKNTLNDIAVCSAAGKAASCGDNVVKIHDLINLQETSGIINLPHESSLDSIEWSADGQLLAVSTQSGSLNVYVSHIMLLTSVFAPSIAILSNLTEVSVYTYQQQKVNSRPLVVRLEVEPSLIAIGPQHLIVGMNDRLWFYDLHKMQNDASSKWMYTRQYVSAVSEVQLNDTFAAILFDGKLLLQKIDDSSGSDSDTSDSITFPESEFYRIQCFSLTSDFLIYCTDAGHICHFSINVWRQANLYKHVGSTIRSVFADPTGTIAIITDTKAQAFLYKAITHECLSIPDVPINQIIGVRWNHNVNDRHVFVVYDDQEIHTYVYIRTSTKGPLVRKVESTPLTNKHVPLLLFGGHLVLATNSGQLSQSYLDCYERCGMEPFDRGDAFSVREEHFENQLKLCRFDDAFNCCIALNSEKCWKVLAEECLYFLEIELAEKAYRRIKDVSMVMSLEQISDVEELSQLCGYMAMFLGDHNLAQQWFLDSSQPELALDMRRDLFHWEEALQLAKKFAPQQIALISREYAQQLEFSGNYSEAFIHYEKALQDTNAGDEHQRLCKCGIARCALQSNNFRHGLAIVNELADRQLIEQCATILDQLKQHQEAAQLWEGLEEWEKAATDYIKLKQWTKITPMLPHIQNLSIHQQYACAKETDGEYRDAVVAYEKAHDFDAVIRIQLNHLQNPEIALELVQETKSMEGARLVAQFFQKLNDFNMAIDYLILAHCFDDAYALALKFNKIHQYGDILVQKMRQSDLTSEESNWYRRQFEVIAKYFEDAHDLYQAGVFWHHAKNYQQAMKMLLESAQSANGRHNESIAMAIETVAAAHSDQLSQRLIDYLLGESDGIPKEPKFIFRLYMARKEFRKAAKTALLIAQEEQINGNYRNAHDVLFNMSQELKRNGIKVQRDMYQNLMLLHSYILGRMHHKRGDHRKSARMLIRVANNIDQFPAHVVPILTSTVIECQRADLKMASLKYASMLIGNSEYRKVIDPKYARKIEAIVRKPPKMDDLVEPETPCPYCDYALFESATTCERCTNVMPLCIATGQHMHVNDFTICPDCEFPALRTEFMEILSTPDVCPMCSSNVDVDSLPEFDNPKQYLLGLLDVDT